MSWTDEEIDTLFGEAANKQVFEYRSEYWNDIEKQLPIKKQSKRAYWWWTANLFFLGFLGLIVVDASKKTNAVQQINSASKSNHGPNNFMIKKAVQTHANTSIQDSNSGLNGKDATYEKNDNTDLIINENRSLVTRLKTESGNFLNGKASFIDKSITSQNHIQAANGMVPIALEKETNGNAVGNIDVIESPHVDKEDVSEGLVLMTKELIFTESDAQLEPVSFQIEKNHLTKMYVEMFGGVGQSYVKNKTNVNSVNASIGGAVGFTYPVKRFNLSAGLGIQATKFDQMNILERTKVYGFGSEILENSYEFSSIYALTIPLSAAYAVGRHSMNLGLTTNINFVTQLKHSQTLNGDFKSYSTGFSDVSFFNRFGLKPSLGYSFSVNEKTQIGVQLNIQLLQQVQSSRFISKPFNFPIDGQIYLKRTLDF